MTRIVKWTRMNKMLVEVWDEEIKNKIIIKVLKKSKKLCLLHLLCKKKKNKQFTVINCQ